MNVSFKVLGVPKAKGSKKFWGMSKKGKPIISEQLNNKSWIDAVRYTAMQIMEGRTPIEGPLDISVNFTMPIPKVLEKKFLHGKISHYPITRTGDLDKLLRAVFDSMNQIAFKDDAQICKLKATKTYGVCPGVWVDISQIE